jgi:translation initiation factor 2 beta subunit (eIF-2beta)/eIF-5
MGWLIGAAVVAGFLVDLYVHPFKPCPRCSGRAIPGTNRGSRRSAFGQCKRCGGTRTIQRIGSKQLHRAVRALVKANSNRKDG